MWLKGLEGKIDRFPIRRSGKMCSIGLPGPYIIWCSEMNRVILAIRADDDTHPGEA